MIRRFGRSEGIYSLIVPAISYSLLAFAILYAMWPYFYYIKNNTFIVIGSFAAWRYGWLMLNYVRSSYYNYVHYPRLKRKVMAQDENNKYPDHIYFVIPSYCEEPWVSVETFQSIYSNLSTIPCKATLVVSTGSDQDDQVIASIHQSHPARDKVELVFQRQTQGKRVAMADALRAVARRYNDEEHSVTVFMDGDSYLESFTLQNTIPFFSAFPDLGALTTNEAAYINTTSRWYKDWFNLKFGQRHILFKSHSLSHKVLTLTGRFSVFRTSIVVKDDFISQMENDIITHWMHGKFRFLMGDDKTSWFYLLKHGWKMLYIPDVTVYSLESRDADFFTISLSLPYRWYGNTLRNNTRALELGWRKTGLFIWFAILDQRLTMWTSLVGITGAVILSLVKSFVYLPFYIAWVLMVRIFQMSVIAFRGHPVTLRTIPLMLYNQWIGAIIKIRAYFNLADQTWAKGKAKQKGGGKVAMIQHRLVRYMPRFTMLFSYGLFFFAMLLSEGALKLPDKHALQSARETHVIYARQYGVTPDDQFDDAFALQSIINRIEPGKYTVIRLPAGQIDLHRGVVINRPYVALEGEGQDRTFLVSHIKGKGKAALLVQGKKEKLSVQLRESLPPGSTRVSLDQVALDTGDLLLLKMPNDEAFLRSIGSKTWNREHPWVRQSLVSIASQNDRVLEIEHPTGIRFDKLTTRIERVHPVHHVRLKGFSIRQHVPGAEIKSVRERYENVYPDYAVDAIRFELASECNVEDVRIHAAGRHALVFESSYACTARRIEVQDAWNKGKGGNGYVRFSRSHYCSLSDSRIRNIRHITLQWSSSHNRLYRLESGVDINLHGGYSHHNQVRDITFRIPDTHHWSAITTTPDNARWAPPDGPGNVITGIKTVR